MQWHIIVWRRGHFLPMEIQRRSLDEIVCELFFLFFFFSFLFMILLINSHTEPSAPVTISLDSSMPVVPKFSLPTDHTATSDEVGFATIDDDDEKTNGFLMASTFATETDGAAGSNEVNVATADDEIVCYWHQHWHHNQRTTPAKTELNDVTLGASDEETGGLLLAPTFKFGAETDGVTSSSEVHNATIKSLS